VKTILLLAHDDRGQEARLQAALVVVRALDAHLICLDVTVIPERMTAYVSRSAGGLLLADEQRNEVCHAARLHQRLSSEAVEFEFIAATGFVSQTILQHAVIADLVVVSSRLKDGFPHMERIVGELLTRGQTPVFAVPEDSTPLNLHGHALVAWDGSPDAEEALRAAVPLLQMAGSVTLVHADDGSLMLPPDEAARYLSRHGIEPVIHLVPPSDERASFVLEDIIARVQPAYVVLGAFSRGRTCEALFGGVTARLLSRSSYPLLLAHRR
jgi:nucleotide-binding universal stress UspA family protein